MTRSSRRWVLFQAGNNRVVVESSIDEQADQISSLYDLLTFSDRPLSPSGLHRDRERQTDSLPKRSVLDVLRLVKESLGEEGMRRLEEDGVVPRRREL